MKLFYHITTAAGMICGIILATGTFVFAIGSCVWEAWNRRKRK